MSRPASSPLIAAPRPLSPAATEVPAELRSLEVMRKFSEQYAQRCGVGVEWRRLPSARSLLQLARGCCTAAPLHQDLLLCLCLL